MKKLALISVVGLALSGCGGSGGGSNSDSTPTQPVVKPSVAIGSVEAVNAEENTLTVNGYTYHVSGGVVYGDTSMQLADVEPKMMVQVGTDVRKASDDGFLVTLEPTITGRVTAIDYVKKTFTVNGVDLQFDGLSDDIEINDWVMVSSLPTADAGYRVLSVVEIDIDNDYPTLGSYYELEGRITSIDENAGTFKLGTNITVSYDNISQLSIGQWVEVEGEMQNGIFMANEVEVEGYDVISNDSDVEGIVTWVANDYSEFSLNYRGAFFIDNATRFEDGSKANLKQGQEVEVTSVMKNGKRIATVIEFEQPDFDDNNQWQGKEFECEGYVSNYDAEARTFDIERCENDADQLLNNTTVVIDAQTRFQGIEELNLNGARVEVDGVIINDQNIAREVELDVYDN
ncbi:putative lipoprotein [Vibrio sp. JCM 18905]|nr:putative lipoprotein [Vibrio sp. JCM 18905]